MPAPQPAKKVKRVPLGSPIDWTDEEMNDLADINLADLRAADALWQRDAPKQYKQLLQAKVSKRGES